MRESPKINVYDKVREGQVLAESPVAKLASHSVVANSACSIGPEPDPSVVVPAVVGGESLEDFRLHKNKFQILNYNDTYEHRAKLEIIKSVIYIPH